MERTESKEKISKEQREMLKNIGGQILHRRRYLRISQKEMADRLSISTSHLSNIESGKTNVSLAIFIEILIALKLSPSEIEKNVRESRGLIPPEKGRLLINSSVEERRKYLSA